MTYILESDTDYLFSEEAICFMMEEASPKVQKNFIQRIIGTLKSMLSKVSQFISKIADKVRGKELEKAVAENPELKNEKVESKNYDQAIDAGIKAVSDIDKAKDVQEAKKILKEYNKKRNRILAVGAVVTVAALAVVAKKTVTKHKSHVQDLESKLKETTDELTNARDDLEKHIELSKGKISQIEQLHSAENEENAAQINKLKGIIDTLQKKVVAIDKEKSELEDLYDDLEKTADKFDRDLRSKKRELSDLIDQQSEAEDTIHRLQRELKDIGGDNEALLKDRKRLLKELDKAKEERDQLGKKLSQAKRIIGKGARKLQNTRLDRDIETKNSAVYRKKIANLTREQDKLNSELKQAKSKLKRALDVNKSRRQRSEKKREEARSKVAVKNSVEKAIIKTQAMERTLGDMTAAEQNLIYAINRAENAKKRYERSKQIRDNYAKKLPKYIEDIPRSSLTPVDHAYDSARRIAKDQANNMYGAMKNAQADLEELGKKRNFIDK